MKMTETLDMPTGHPGCRPLAMVWTQESKYQAMDKPYLNQQKGAMRSNDVTQREYTE